MMTTSCICRWRARRTPLFNTTLAPIAEAFHPYIEEAVIARSRDVAPDWPDHVHLYVVRQYAERKGFF